MKSITAAMLKLRRSPRRRRKSRRAAAAVKQKSVEFQLPEEIIQHIQSFMDAKEAARAALLSKSWHRAWSTRPILSFHQSFFPKKGFRRFAKKTMQRYEDLNLRILNFNLQIESEHKYQSLAADLISRAIKLGATDFQIQTPPWFDLPDEVLQSKTLEFLRVDGCTIGGKNKLVTSCSNLKYLELSYSYLNPDVIRDLLSKCPLIEELAIEPLWWHRPLPFDVATLIKLQKLEFLRLVSLDFGKSLYKSDHLWPNLACLKELRILDFTPNPKHKNKVVRICSASLERIHVWVDEGVFLARRALGIVDWEFDVPNLRTFRYKGTVLPRIKLKTSRKDAVEAELAFCIRCREASRASWFGSLNELVRVFGARASLSLFLYDASSCGGGYVGDGLAIPPMEYLTIRGCSDAVLPSFLEALFWSCRPNFVSIDRCLLRCVKDDGVEVFQQLQALPWKTLLDDPRNSQPWKTLLDDPRNSKEGFVRFQLK